MFMPETLRDGRLLPAFSLEKMCIFMNGETFCSLATNPSQHFQPVIHH